MKAISAEQTSASRPPRDGMCLAFFFNARGAPIERCPQGMYRSLVHQLLNQSDALMQGLCMQFKQKGVLSQDSIHWSIGQLSRVFHETISNYRDTAIYIFVDALDECEEDEVRQIVKNFEKSVVAAVRNGTNLRICWSNRHYPHISVTQGLEIRMEDRNASDINLYVEQELRLPEEYDRGQLKRNLIQKASGVFLWVLLVVRRLLKASDQGLKHTELEGLLSTIPNRLEDYFAKIFENLNPSNREKSLTLMGLVLCSFRPLKISEVHLAIEIDTVPPPRKLEQVFHFMLPLPMELRRIERLLNDLSHGLVEVVSLSQMAHDRNYATRLMYESTVQVIYESVRDFLLGERGLKKIDPSQNYHYEDRYSSSHSRISRICTKWFGLDEFRTATVGSSSESPSGIDIITHGLCKPIILPADLLAHSFTSYAFEYLFRHMTLSEDVCLSVEESRNETETKTCNRFALEGWLFYCAFRLYESGQTVSSSALCWRIGNGLKFVCQNASTFLLTSADAFTLVSCFDNLQLCFSDSGHLSLLRGGMKADQTLHKVSWPTNLLPSVQPQSGLESSLRALGAHAATIRFVIGSVSGHNEASQYLERQPVSLLELKLPLPACLKITDFTILARVEIPSSCIVFSPEFYENFCQTYKAMSSDSQYVSLLLVEKPNRAAIIGEQCYQLELLDWKFDELPDSVWASLIPGV